MIMKIGPKTIGYLTGIITGDTKKSAYMTGRELVYFFNQLGFNDIYDNFFGTRRIYCQEKINFLNNSGRIKELIEKYYSPVEFIDRTEEYEILVDELNKYLYYDGLKLTRRGRNVVLEDITDDTSNNDTLENGQIILHINAELYNHISEFLKNEDYFHAVEEAYKFVREKLKELTGEEKATEVFKKEENIEKIFGQKPNNSVQEDFVKGVKFIHMGVQYLRNEKVHSLAKKIDKNEALHYIALASLAYELISDKNH